MRKKLNRNQRGFTLLEYCAGAAMVMAVLFTAISGVGTSAKGLLDSISRSLDTQATRINGK